MKEAFDLKSFLLWESKFPDLFFFFFLAICYISSLSGQINTRAFALIVSAHPYCARNS